MIFSTVLKNKIQEAHDKEVLSLATAVYTHEMYLEVVGYLRGLRDAIAICEEVEKDHE